MLEKMLSLLAPHYCCGCDTIGSLLCGHCKFDIVSERQLMCIACRRPTARDWLCPECKVPYERAWAVNTRTGVLQRLIGLYKFERAKDAYKILGDLLLDILPELPVNTVIVPVPTTPPRIRERGYDHMLLISKYVAQKRGLKCEQLIERMTYSKQRQANAQQRTAQARKAFAVDKKLNSTIPYLLIDDIITTGATIKYASKALRNAGAEHVWVAVIARQTLK